MAAKQKYPWDAWADGAYRVLIEGRDYSCTLQGLRVQMSREAARRGLFVRTKFVPGGGNIFDENRGAMIFRFTADPNTELVVDQALPFLGEYVRPMFREQFPHIFQASSHAP